MKRRNFLQTSAAVVATSLMCPLELLGKPKASRWIPNDNILRNYCWGGQRWQSSDGKCILVENPIGPLEAKIVTWSKKPENDPHPRCSEVCYPYMNVQDVPYPPELKWIFNERLSTYISRYDSPCGNYTISVKEEAFAFAITRWWNFKSPTHADGIVRKCHDCGSVQKGENSPFDVQRILYPIEQVFGHGNHLYAPSFEFGAPAFHIYENQ